MKAVAGLCLVLLIAGAEAHAACEDIGIEFTETTTPRIDRAQLAQDLRTAAGKVCTWWGPTFNGRLTVDVLEEDRPSMALIPAWRGRLGHMFFPAAPVRRGNAATVHEVVHVFAPNANRFLAEGLAVYAHDFLSGPPAFPNFGRDIMEEARRHADWADIAALERLPTPTVLLKKEQRAAYAVSGSFVRYLVDRHGMEKFRKLYAMTPLMPGQRNAGDPARWVEVYGHSVDELSQEWRKVLPAAP
jgi:hypothetical protein